MLDIRWSSGGHNNTGRTIPTCRFHSGVFKDGHCDGGDREGREMEEVVGVHGGF